MKTQHTGNLPAAVHLKLNVPIELTSNIDVSDGLTNGTTGIIHNWSKTAEGQVATLYVAFQNPACGAKARAQHKRQSQILGVQLNLTPVQRSGVRFRLTAVSPIEILRMQFPIRLCAARTIHRVQGASLQKCIIDLSGRSMAGLHYVSTSRMIDENGVWFLNFNFKAISASVLVTAQYNHMRNSSRLELTLPDLTTRSSATFCITALNARSLHANIVNIRSDKDLISNDLLIVSETWAVPSDNPQHYAIAGFSAARFDTPMPTFDSRPHRGILVYHRNMPSPTMRTFSSQACDIVTLQVQTEWGMLNIICIYRSPSMPMSTFLQKLGTALHSLPQVNPVIIMGDFNVDIAGMSAEHAHRLALENTDHHLRALVQFMFSKSCSQIVRGPTVNSGLQIDHIWTDLHTKWPIRHVQPHILTSFCSDHNPVGLLLS